jgi:hypothetical protein
MTDPETYPLSIGDAARLIGVSTERVRAIDAKLSPIRNDAGMRRYRVDVVSQYASTRRATQLARIERVAARAQRRVQP